MNARLLLLISLLALSPCVDAYAEDAGEKQDPMLYPVLKGGTWGYIDETGKLVIEPRFKMASYFRDGLARVILKDWPGYIDRTGKLVVEDKFMLAGEFSDGLAFAVEVNVDRELAFIDTKGNVAVRLKGKGFDLDDPSFPYPRFSEGYAVFYMKPGYGVLDKHGKVVVKPTYKHLDDFSHGLARALVDDKKWGKWGYIDASGELIIPAKFDLAYSFSDGLACVAQQVGEKRFEVGYIDTKGNYALKLDHEMKVGPPCVYEEVWGWRFSEGLACVRKGYLAGYIDKKGKFVIPPQFDSEHAFSGGLTFVCDFDGKMSFIDKTGKPVFRVPGYHAEDFVGPLAKVWNGKGDKLGYIDKTGKYVWPPTD